MGKQSKHVELSAQKLFQIRACVISARKANLFDVTTMFTYYHANTPLGQSERSYYLSYFINIYGHATSHVGKIKNEENRELVVNLFWRF